MRANLYPVPCFDLCLQEGRLPYPEAITSWNDLPALHYDGYGEAPGKLVDRWVLPFFTMNTYTANLSNKDGKVHHAAAGSGPNAYVNNMRISYNLIAVGVLV